ncbi:MAG: succinate dehydrogenase assembly factor 2 [Pseudomonadales bacterium]
MQSTKESARIAHNRVIWHSRRGMLELDIVLEPFARDCYAGLDSDAQADYRRLLECEDQQLYDWLLKKSAADDAALEGIIDTILLQHSRRTAGT